MEIAVHGRPLSDKAITPLEEENDGTCQPDEAGANVAVLILKLQIANHFFCQHDF